MAYQLMVSERDDVCPLKTTGIFTEFISLLDPRCQARYTYFVSI
jgi:hypothetical protein